MPASPIDDAERAAINAEYRRYIAACAPLQPGPYGCLIVIVVACLYFGLPSVLRFFGVASLPPPYGTVVTVIAVIAGVIGLLMSQIGSIGAKDPLSHAEQALAVLGDPALADPAARRGAAIALLFHGAVLRQRTAPPRFDFGAARARLGPALDYVCALESVLLAEGLLQKPVFTGAQP